MAQSSIIMLTKAWLLFAQPCSRGQVRELATGEDGEWRPVVIFVPLMLGLWYLVRAWLYVC
jgi:hypothetical protein